jgi:hypothetical protein
MKLVGLVTNIIVAIPTAIINYTTDVGGRKEAVAVHTADDARAGRSIVP